jgi:probable rRNA maturation factor
MASKTSKIYIHNAQKDLKIPEEKIRDLVFLVLKGEKASCDEVYLSFVTKKTIASLHEQFFQDPSPTDCITLPIDPPGEKPYCVLGDGFICPKIAIEYAKEHEISPEKELFLYVIHVILHMLGYLDSNEKDRKKMQKKEHKYLLAFSQSV